MSIVFKLSKVNACITCVNSFEDCLTSQIHTIKILNRLVFLHCLFYKWGANELFPHVLRTNPIQCFLTSLTSTIFGSQGDILGGIVRVSAFSYNIDININKGRIWKNLAIVYVSKVGVLVSVVTEADKLKFRKCFRRRETEKPWDREKERDRGTIKQEISQTEDREREIQRPVGAHIDIRPTRLLLVLKTR